MNIEFEKMRIIELSAADLYFSFFYNEPIVIKNEKNRFDERFSEIMPLNLDIIYLNSINLLKLKRLGSEYYTEDFVNVSFEHPLFVDENNKHIIPKKTDTKDYTKYSTATIREYFYKNGFVLNGKTYVRYKRASGSARNGSCLFIRKELFRKMNEWSKAGLDEDTCYKSITSYEAYRALSLSSIISSLRLNPRNILFVDDKHIILEKQKVIRVYQEENTLNAEEATCSIDNNIFDGEGLLDRSVFEKCGFENHGMMLLRNRFFKCCAFNTNLQQWFKDNGVTSIEQLNGKTSAKCIEDIVLVVSESCLKYIKMCDGKLSKENIEKWCENITDDDGQSLFGVVKTDKPTRFFDGDMVETTYQLLNSLQIKEKKMSALIAPYMMYIDYIRDLKNTPEFIRYYLEHEYIEKNDDDSNIPLIDDSEYADELLAQDLVDYTGYTFKDKVCLELLKITEDVKNTKLFKNRVLRSVIDSMKLKLYNGRVLVHGTYATLFGNPYEYLLYTLKSQKDKAFETTLLSENEIYSPFFNDGQTIVGSRAPHITMGNVLLAKNKKCHLIDKYFNLTREIVVVDAIKNNIQHRLSGCDYDSDTILLTDNQYLVDAAKLNYNRFLVPFTDFKSKDTENASSNKTKQQIVEELIRIDGIISQNNVGRIVNLSQLLNSNLWNNFNRNNSELISETYKKIAILSALSGAEIDRAKRPFDFASTKVLNDVQRFAKDKYGVEIDGETQIKQPLFYSNISNEKHRKLRIGEIEKMIAEPDREVFKTSMDLLWIYVNETGFKNTRTEGITLFELINKDAKAGGSKYKQADEAIKSLKEIGKILSLKHGKKEKKKQFELEKQNFQNEIENGYQALKHKIDSPQKVKIIIKKLEAIALGQKVKDLEEEDDGPSAFTLLYILLYMVWRHSRKIGYNLASLFPDNTKPLNTLKKCDEGTYILFNKYYFNTQATKRNKSIVFARKTAN